MMDGDQCSAASPSLLEEKWSKRIWIICMISIFHCLIAQWSSVLVNTRHPDTKLIAKFIFKPIKHQKLKNISLSILNKTKKKNKSEQVEKLFYQLLHPNQIFFTPQKKQWNKVAVVFISNQIQRFLFLSTCRHSNIKTFPACFMKTRFLGLRYRQKQLPESVGVKSVHHLWCNDCRCRAIQLKFIPKYKFLFSSSGEKKKKKKSLKSGEV